MSEEKMMITFEGSENYVVSDELANAVNVAIALEKPLLIKDLFKDNELHKVILFSSSKAKVREVRKTLQSIGLKADEMHSDLTQAQRDSVMHEFRNGRVDVLVATDIVSRGIDIDDIPLVINYDVPSDAEDYVHRIGRTARADHDGIAITLVRGKEISKFMQIEQFLGHEVEKIPLPKGLGKAPEYKATEPRKGGHPGKKKGKYRGKGGFKKKNGKPKEPRKQ